MHHHPTHIIRLPRSIKETEKKKKKKKKKEEEEEEEEEEREVSPVIHHML